MRRISSATNWAARSTSFSFSGSVLTLGWVQAESDNSQVTGVLSISTSAQGDGAGIEAGAALETTCALPLPELGVVVMGKSEYVSFLERAVAAPENKDHSSFNTLALGFGILSAIVWFTGWPWSGVAIQEAVASGMTAVWLLLVA